VPHVSSCLLTYFLKDLTTYFPNQVVIVDMAPDVNLTATNSHIYNISHGAVLSDMEIIWRLRCI
jgi:hypothetical protein